MGKIERGSQEMNLRNIPPSEPTSGDNKKSRDFVDMRSVMIEKFKEIETLYHNNSYITGIPAGFRDMERLTGEFPQDEKFGIVAQIRRAAVSIPSNIAEGYGRNMLKDYIRFLRISRGSLLELETQMIISNNLKYISDEILKEILEKTGEISKMLNGLVKSLEK